MQNSGIHNNNKKSCTEFERGVVVVIAVFVVTFSLGLIITGTVYKRNVG